MLFPQLIKANLKTHYIGREIEYFQRLESTNLEAIELIESGSVGNGTVVITDQQFKGKGRQGRPWFSSPGKSVTFSIILQAKMPTEQIGLLSIATSVATAKSVEKFGLSPSLKWPNDIYLLGKKCGGILVQTRVSRTDITWAVIGIGINVNERTEELSDELQTTATTLIENKGTPLQRELVIAWILNSLEPTINQLTMGKSTTVREAWLTRCAHLNQTITFSENGQKKNGIFTGITESGAAVIALDGIKTTLSGEEISISI